MNSQLGYQPERQIILVDEQQQQDSKDKQLTKGATATHGVSPIDTILLSPSNSIIVTNTNEDRVRQLHAGLALRMAHPRIVHPIPVVAMKYSPILEAINKLEAMSQIMDLVDITIVKPKASRALAVTVYDGHESQDTRRPPTVKPAPATVTPHAIATCNDSDNAREYISMASSHVDTASEPAAVASPPSMTTASQDHSSTLLVPECESTANPITPRSITASTQTEVSFMHMYNRSAVGSSRLRTYSIADTTDTITQEHNGSTVCDKAVQECVPNTLRIDLDSHLNQHQALKTGRGVYNSNGGTGAILDTAMGVNSTTFPLVHSASVPIRSLAIPSYNKVTRPPMAPRAMSLFKKRSSMYTHQTMAHSDSVIAQQVSTSETTKVDSSYNYNCNSNNKRQSRFSLSSLSSSFLAIARPSRSRSCSNASITSLKTSPSTTALNDYFITKRQSQTDQYAYVQSPQEPSNPITKPAKSPIARPFSQYYNTGREHPLSNLSHSQSTPTLLIPGQFNKVKESLLSRQAECNCSNRQLSGPCLLHKKLPSLPPAKLEDKNHTSQFEDKKRPKRISVKSTAASIRSFVSSVKKPRSHVMSVESLTLPDLPYSRDSRPQIHTNTTLPHMHPKEPFSGLGPPRSTSPYETKKAPSSIFHRAIKRHAGADVLQSEKPSRSDKKNLLFQPTKHLAVNGFKGQPSRKGIPQSHSQGDQMYTHPMSASTPCFAHSTSVMQATGSSSDSGRHASTIAKIRQAAESAPNLSLHGATQVLAVNAHAEITVHPTSVIAPAIPRGGSIVVASPSFDIPSNEQCRSFVPTLAGSPSTTWTSSFSHGVGPYGKENVSFFEPFQAHAKGRSGQSSKYVSFHFDLSHLENAEHDDDNDAISTTQATMVRTKRSDYSDYEIDSVEEDGLEVMGNFRWALSSPAIHPTMSLLNVNPGTKVPEPPFHRIRATQPPKSPPRSRSQERSWDGISSDEDKDSFHTLYHHLRTVNGCAPVVVTTSASAPSPPLTSQPLSDHLHPFKSLLSYDQDGSEHRENLCMARGASNTSTMSLPAMLSSLLPSSGSTTSLPLHSTRAHMRREPRLASSRSALSRNKWNWNWWRNSKSLNTNNGAHH